MSLSNPMQWPFEERWFAWRPVRTDSGIKWLCVVGKREHSDQGYNFLGQPYLTHYYTYFDLPKDNSTS